MPDDVAVVVILRWLDQIENEFAHRGPLAL
jgi:hypothetical protein